MTELLRGLTWDHPRAYEGLESQSNVFHETQDHIRVQWERQSLRGFEATPIAENAEKYDLIILDHPFVGDAALSGCLVDLSQITKLQAHNSPGRFAGCSLETYKFSGGLWALPLDAACQTAVYRPDLLSAQEVPRTINQVLDNHLPTGLGLAMACPHAFMNFLSLCGLAGADISGTGDRLVDQEVGEEAVDTLRRLAEKIPSDAFDWSSIELLEAMATDDRIAYAPMVFCFNSYSRPPLRPRRQLKYASLPSMRDDGSCAGSVIGGTGIALSSYSAHKDQAAELIDYLVSDVAQIKMAVDGGQPAAHAAWVNGEAIRANGNFFSDCMETMRGAIVRPRYPGYIELQNRAGDLLKDDAKTRERSARRVVDRIEEIYRSTRPHASP